MEKVNLGVVRLPPGFRFHPTDEELVVQYLKRKVYSFPLPASIIPDLDVCKSDPWDLPGDSGQERYFFSTREAKYPNGNRSNRATHSGYWKATGKDKPILMRGGGIVVGMKKTLVFYHGKPPHGSRTDWIMHEYRLANHQSTLPQAKGDWVLCRIFLKKRGNAVVTRKDEDQEEEIEEEEEKEEVICNGNKDFRVIANRTSIKRSEKTVFYDFMGADLNQVAPCSSSSGSSAVTQLSSNNDDSSEEREENSSSSCNSSIIRPFP